MLWGFGLSFGRRKAEHVVCKLIGLTCDGMGRDHEPTFGQQELTSVSAALDAQLTFALNHELSLSLSVRFFFCAQPAARQSHAKHTIAAGLKRDRSSLVHKPQ